MINRMLAGILALCFVLFIARRTSRTQRHSLRRLGTAAVLVLVLTTTLPHPADAADAFTDGAVVRVQSNSIEHGWFTGRIRLDKTKCWMVHLDQPTKDHYTMLALLVIDELQVSRGGQWASVAVKAVLEASPAVCREYGAD